MALRLILSSAAKNVRHSSSKMVRSSGKQNLLQKYLVASDQSCCATRTCSTSCGKRKLQAQTFKPKAQFSTTAMALADTPDDQVPAKGTLDPNWDTIPHDLDGLVGHAKVEVEAFHGGHADPWDWDPREFGVGSRQNPILVPTLLDDRVVACMCEGEEGADASFLTLTWEEPCQRCNECGNVYQLVDGPIFDKVGAIEGEDHYEHEHH